MLPIAIRKWMRNTVHKVNSINYPPAGTSYSKGFTLLELIITIGIIAAALTLASTPDLELSRTKTYFNNTFNDLQGELSTLRNEALLRNTTTRMVITSSSGTYTINTYYSPSPVTTCNAAGAWTAMESAKKLDLSSRYQITGTALSDICFYRDGTSSGGTYVIAPITVTAGLKTATITVTIATGYMDVEVTN